MEDVIFKDLENKEVSLNAMLGEKWGWQTSSGTKIIRHSAVQQLARISGFEVFSTKWPVTPSDSNLQQHIVEITLIHPSTGKKCTEMGEASRLNTGFLENGTYKEYKDSKGKSVIDANYRGSMAWKRAFDRAVLSFLGIYELYSSSESPDFIPTSDTKTGEVTNGYDY